jgi:hypothetical protein
MSEEVSVAIGILTAITCWLAIKHAFAAHRAIQQQRIANAGTACLGKIVAIQRPFLLDDCTRLYFDFVPSGMAEPVRACHVARDTDDAQGAALPSQGAIVSVRYLPNQPRSAVIGKLVTR